MAFVYGLRHAAADGTPTPVQTTLEARSADVRQIDVHARKQAWRQENWDGPAGYVADRMTEASHEVTVRTRYAEASVSVHRVDGETERRRCSLCLN